MAGVFGKGNAAKEVVVEDAVEVAPVEPPIEAVVMTPKQPVFSKDGVLLNPEDCVVGSDGVVSVKPI